MAKSLYRGAGGLLLRSPIGLGYPHAGKLMRGIEICCPSWDIGQYCAAGCLVQAGVKSSWYTPNYFDVTPDNIVRCNVGGDPIQWYYDQVNGATWELVNVGGCTWRYTERLYDSGPPVPWWDLTMEIWHNAGPDTWSLLITLDVGTAKFSIYYDPVIAGFACRVPTNSACDYGIGDCGNQVGGDPAHWVGGHSGDATIVIG